MASVTVFVAHLVVDAGFVGVAGGRELFSRHHAQLSDRAADR